MKRNMQIESIWLRRAKGSRSTFCATNITNLQLGVANTIRMAFVKLVAACGFVKCTSSPDGKLV